MADSSPELSIVVPAYNEEARLRPSLVHLADWLATRGETWEVFVVDDGSTDATASIAREFAASHAGFSLLELPANRGKGAAVRHGLATCRGRAALFTDADLSTPLEEFGPMRDALDAGADLVMASRALPDSRLEIRQAWYRELMGRTFNAFVRAVTGIPFHDTQCGFKLLRGDHARALATEMSEDGFAFDVELVLLARRKGLEIRELPVTWRNDEASRVNALTDSWRMLLALRRILSRVGRYRA